MLPYFFEFFVGSFIPCQIPDIWAYSSHRKKKKRIWEAGSSVYQYCGTTMVVTHAVNKLPPPRIFLERNKTALWAGFYLNLHQTRPKPSQGDHRHPLKIQHLGENSKYIYRHTQRGRGGEHVGGLAPFLKQIL